MRVIENTLCEDGVLRSVSRAIAENREALCRLAQGGRAEYRGIQFRVIQSDRNAVLEARPHAQACTLIAKFATPRNRFPGITEWEANQWCSVHASLRHREGAATIPSLLAYSDEFGILLLESFQGHSLHHALKRSVVDHWRHATAGRMSAACTQLGETVRHLHACCPFEDASPMVYDLPTKLESARLKGRADPTFRDGMTLFDRHYRQLAPTCWTHGNLRTDNVLLTNRGVALIDLENAGRGTAMGDLGRLLAFLLAFRRVRLFPRRFWCICVESLLGGYGAAGTIDPPALVASVLGETLVLYGRDLCGERCSFRDRVLRDHVRKVIVRLCGLLDSNPERVVTQPESLVT